MAAKTEAFPSQQFIEVKTIEDDIVWTREGNLRKILLVSGINFDLKSEEEKSIIVFAFQNLLNSLDFSLQFFVHSRRLNIDRYLRKLNDIQKTEPSELLKNQIGEYQEFIRSFVNENAIMAKNFFVVVPYDPIPISKAGMDLAKKVFGLFRSKTTEEAPAAKPREENISQLTLRVDQAINGLNQIGLRAVPLNNDELVELFFNLYNPTEIEKEEVPTQQEE